jgi:hypothetical protein
MKRACFETAKRLVFSSTHWRYSRGGKTAALGIRMLAHQARFAACLPVEYNQKPHQQRSGKFVWGEISSADPRLQTIPSRSH